MPTSLATTTASLLVWGGEPGNLQTHSGLTSPSLPPLVPAHALSELLPPHR